MCTLIILLLHYNELMKPPASVEDLAFKKMPEVGPAPDMIFDDLPTNLDYLDESFGAAAGLRELVDEDLDQFSDDEIDIQTSPTTLILCRELEVKLSKYLIPKGLMSWRIIICLYPLTIPGAHPSKSLLTSALRSSFFFSDQVMQL